MLHILKDFVCIVAFVLSLFHYQAVCHLSFLVCLHILALADILWIKKAGNHTYENWAHGEDPRDFLNNEVYELGDSDSYFD